MPSVHVDPSKVHEFPDEQSFYEWLRANWDKEQEVWIKIHKARSGLPSITPAQAIDAALCWGWIDGIRKGFDEKSFLQRYTPRKKNSTWSKINIANVERLSKAGRMQPPGLAHVEAAKADGRWDKAYRIADNATPADLLAAIRANAKALATYQTLTSQNRFALTFRTLRMQTDAGRKKKIAELVAMLAKGKTIYPNGKGGGGKGAGSKSAGAKSTPARGTRASRSTEPARATRATKAARAPAARGRARGARAR